MKYVKTFEQVQDFYGSGSKYHIIVSQDENWYVKSNKNYSAAEMNDDDGYEIFPMSELTDIDIDNTYNFNNTMFALKSLNNLVDGDHIAVSFENYDKYGEDLDVEKREHYVETREEVFDYLKSQGYPNMEDLTDKSDDEVREIYYKSGALDFEDGDPTSHLVVGMKFKSVEFTMGLQKSMALNI